MRVTRAPWRRVEFMRRLEPSSGHLRLFVTPEHDCNYLDDHKAITLFADPDYPKSPQLQGLLAQQGYRRSGQHLYRPRCGACQACIPIRLPVERFRPNRSQQRCQQQNQDLQVQLHEAEFTEERFQLYCRYQSARHSGGGMDQPTPQQFSEFLFCDWAQTALVEFRDQGRLLAVAACDLLPEALSAVYTFFEPEAGRRSLGVFAVLWQVQQARRQNLRWLYLGYLIHACRKMAYKANYLPHERLLDAGWREFNSPCEAQSAAGHRR